MSRKSSTENNIHAIHNLNTFLKVKPAFEINKILFSFVETEKNTNKKKNNIDCYMSVSAAALLARKITSFRIYQAITAEKQKGEQYPKDVWKSPLGGVNENDAKKRGLRNDGYAISRVFSIAPGSSKYAVITARSQAGKTDTNGLIVPVADNNSITIRIALSSHDELEELGIMLEAAVNAYMAEQCKKTVEIQQ